MLIYSAMNLTVREELTILTLIFIFSAMTIPIIIVTSNEYKKAKVNQKVSVIPESPPLYPGYHGEMLINAVKIIEEINQVQSHSDKFDQITLYDILNMKSYEMHELYESVTREFKKQNVSVVGNIWKNFNFANDTLLASKSTVIPLRVDWRDRGVVSPIKAQNACSACWAFATIGTIESMNALKTGELIELSTEQMVECNDDEMNCKTGGDTYRLLRWLYENQTNIQPLSNFPFTNGDDKCFVDDKPGVRVKDFSINDFTDKEHLMLAYIAYHGPLITCVNSINWRNYMNGVIQQHCSGKKYLNHAVEIVGYDLTGDVPHYIIKNTWSDRYGIDGYLKIAIGNNVCGIAERVSAVVV